MTLSPTTSIPVTDTVGAWSCEPLFSPPALFPPPVPFPPEALSPAPFALPNSLLHSQSFRKYPIKSRRTYYMYCYKDDKCDTFKELTSSGGLSDPGDKRMFG